MNLKIFYFIKNKHNVERIFGFVLYNKIAEHDFIRFLKNIFSKTLVSALINMHVIVIQ